MRYTKLVTFVLFSLSSVFAQPAAKLPNAVAKQPVFIYLFTKLDDPYHFDITSERFAREVAEIEKQRAAFPQYTPSVLLQFNGATTQQFGQFGDAGPMEVLHAATKSGAVEIGYDGVAEPTYLARTLPDFRKAKDARDRWLARFDAARYFLTEFKHWYTGEPDPSRSGGLQKTQEVFGPVASITGLTLRETGADSEFVHQIRSMNPNAVMAGLPDRGTWFAKNLAGYSDSVIGVSNEMSSPSDTAAEVFWQDGYLRVSESSGREITTIVANEGLASLKTMLEKLDRSRIHVLRVELGPSSIHLKANLDPIRYSVDNPKKNFLDPDQLRPREEVDAAYRREAELLAYLEKNFFPANPGSRFLGPAELQRMATTNPVTQVPREVLVKAAANLVSRWDDLGTHPPSYAFVDGQEFSLAQMFQMMATALAERHKTGHFPDAVRLGSVYGPAPYNQAIGPIGQTVTAGMLDSICSEMAPGLNDESLKPFPSNILPGTVNVAGAEINVAQVLHLMAEAVASESTHEFKVKLVEVNSAVGLVYPRMRPLAEEGASWTLKPARLDWKQRTAAVR